MKDLICDWRLEHPCSSANFIVPLPLGSPTPPWLLVFEFGWLWLIRWNGQNTWMVNPSLDCKSFTWCRGIMWIVFHFQLCKMGIRDHKHHHNHTINTNYLRNISLAIQSYSHKPCDYWLVVYAFESVLSALYSYGHVYKIGLAVSL